MFFTIGTSTMSIAQLIALLVAHGIDYIFDIRSMPYSRYTPQFNKDNLKAALEEAGIGYYHAAQLGGRPADESLYTDGVADYELMAKQPAFLRAIESLERGQAQGRQICLLCTEGNLLTCHRSILVGRELRNRGNSVLHIGRYSDKTQQDVEKQLMQIWNTDIDTAYRLQNMKIGWHKR